MKEIYINCECGTEILRIEYDEQDEFYYLSIYKLDKEHSLRNKLRYIWKIIKIGEPYEDQIVITKKQISKLSNFLKEK